MMEHTGNQAVLEEGAFVFPASFAQQRLWFLDKLMPGSAMYNIPFAIRLQGNLNVDALKRSLEEIVDRHETLRTIFIEEGGAPMQVILPEVSFELPMIDLRHVPAESRMDHAKRMAFEDANRPFDLSKGPLMRTALLELNEEEHVLLLNMHHIISDGWSCGVMMKEVRVLYEAFVNNLPSPLPELPIQYVDFTNWQLEHLSGAELERQVSYWKKQLGDHPPVLQLPTDRPRPAVQSHRGASVEFVVPKALTDRLIDLTQTEGVTLYMTLLSAFVTLLYRYSGQDDIAVGSPIAGRNNAQIEGLIGFFVNTLVMRTDLSGRPTFREVLSRVRTTALDAYAHQDLPFERLVEEVQPERNMSYTPLFQTMFALQNAPKGAEQMTGLKMSGLDADHASAKFDLNLAMSESKNGLYGTIQYSTDLFDEATILRMTEHFTELLQGIAADPDREIAALPLLTAEEADLTLVEWNRNRVDYPHDLTIPQMFDEQVARVPAKVALSFEGAELTYGELDRRANQLARLLQKKGVGPDVLVGLCTERSLEMVVGMLGILKAGGAYVPLDPAYPQDRLSYMLEDSGVSVLLTQEKLIDDLPAHGAELICLDRDWPHIALEGEENLDVALDPEHLAYMIYTSGSTGKPKGVLIPHRGVARLVKNSNYLIFGEEEVFLQLAAISFDAATPEVWGALLNGAKLVVFPAMTPTIDEVIRVLSEEKVTVALLTSGLLPQLAEADLEKIGHLKLLSVGGDVMSAPHAKKFLQKLPGCLLANAYGPTENTVASTTIWLSQPEEVAGVVPIGRAISNNELYVLDSLLQPVPIGVPGELHVGGPGLARGYLNRPELTEEKFIRNPFREDGSRLYKTGDLVRYLPDGNLEFLGRIDHQVKVRGFRIELGEIEAVIGQHAAVKETIVIVREDVPGDKRITAYVVGNGVELTTIELRNHVKQQVPEYMVPSAFVLLDQIPLTPNGKVDRKALPLPDGTRSAELEYVLPESGVQEKLASIWAEILRIDRVGQHDNFFELGGHSLLATRLMSRVHDEFGIELPLRTLFEAPTLSELAGCIVAASGQRLGMEDQGPTVTSRGASSENEEEVAFPTSFAQQRLWFLDQLIPNSPLYNIPLGFRIYGVLDVAALEASFNEIARRHETLRTTFRKNGTIPEQVIKHSLQVPLPIISLQELPAAEREAEAMRLAGEEARLPFDLAKGPLVRAQLLQLDQQDHVLLFTIHHIIADGWSYGVLVKEITQLYQAFANGEPSPLPDLPLQYADFAVWQRDYLQGEVLEGQINYWKQQLGGTLPVLELPTDFKRPAVQTYNGDGMSYLLPKDLADKLQALSQQEGTTLFMTLLAAFNTLLFHYTKQDDILIGTPIANRNRSGIEGLIGFFVNTLVIRSDLSGNPSFLELVKRVRETALAAFQYQDVPFEKLVEELQPDRDQSHSPVFQVMFALQNFESDATVAADITLVPLSQDSKTSKFDLLWTMAERTDGLIVSIEYNVDLFRQATMERMLGHFHTLLEAITVDPAQPIAVLPLMTEEEERGVRELAHGIALDDSDGKCAHQLFEEQVARTPDAVALVLDEAQVTYRELNERANRLAHHLRARGVQPEALVGLCMGRSLELVVATLGILKAGGAYVPLDPAHPKDRIEFILKDAEVGVLVTQADLVDDLPTDGVEVVALDRDWEEIEKWPSHDLNAGETLDNALYVIYTSGTTGKPKGVMMTHRPLRNMISWQLKETPFAPLERTLQYASMTFDISFQEYFCTLTTGGTLVLVKEEVRRDPLRLLRYLSEQGVHRIYLPFVAFQQLCEVAESLSERLPLQLKEITTAGDQLQTTRPVRNWLASLEGCRLYNQYGPTECHVVTSYTLPLGQEEWPLLPPIGRPIANTQIYILDQQMRPVPLGVPGEVYIGGISLARGYLKREEMTAEKFITDPFSKEQGARMYRTGDLARYLPDGNIEFFGRIDTQVKIRGYRIELGEIETILGQHPGVLETVVMAREESEGAAKTLLVAYVVLDQELEPSTQELRSFLKDRLPEYMVPQLFMPIDAVPLTPNRKIDRKALPAPDGSRLEAAESYVAPRTATEQLMADIFGEVLKVERVGIHDHFFDLGGHSLLATQLISRIREVFGMELPVRALFEAATVASIVEYMKHHSELATGIKIPPIVPVGRDRELPLSFAQQRLWFIDRLTKQSSYNMFSGVRFSGELNVEALDQALQEIVRRHEVLRTTFSMVENRPVQVVQANYTHRLERIDLQHLSKEACEAEILRVAGEEARKPFDLSTGPLFRSTMLRASQDEVVLLFSMHHIVSDGWSIGVFVRELGELYAAFAEGRETPLAELEVQYADFAHWQRAWLQGDNLQAQLAHWKDRLQGAKTVLPLPHDHPRPPVPTLRGGSHALRISKDLSDRLQALCQQEGVTMYMTLLAALNTLLYRYSGQDDILIGSPIAGRNRKEIEPLIGFFVNTIVLRTDLSAQPSFRELLQRVRQSALDSYAHQDLPFEKLVEEIQPNRDMSISPLFQVMFAVQNAPMGDLTLPGVTMSALEAGGGVANFELSLMVYESEEGQLHAFNYQTDLFDPSTIERMAGHLEQLLTAIVDDPDRKLTELSLLTPAEEAMLEGWNAVSDNFPRRCAHQLIAEHARTTPDAVAAEFAGETLSYQELDERANRLAHHLQTFGVGPDVLVGVCMDKSLAMVISLLAVLKAGGAYVPIDPSHPKERIAYLIEDAEMVALLTKRELASGLPTDVPLIFAEEEASLAEYPITAPNSAVEPHHLAYMLYTSGSTGKPKAVMIEHAQLVSTLSTVLEQFDFSRETRMLSVTTMTFDVSVAEVFAPLLSGGTTVLMSKDRVLDLAQLVGEFRSATTCLSVPSLMRHVAQEVMKSQAPVTSMRTVLVGGEAVTADLQAELRQAFPNANVIVAYGPTEATILCSFHTVEAEPSERLVIGRALKNGKFRVCDGDGQRVPVGVPGELYIGGHGVGRGYRNQPELTAASFVWIDGERWYKSGDLVRYLADGSLEFLGRIDTQVKVRGFRIEIGEIESLLTAHPNVALATVLAIDDPHGEKRLVAYVEAVTVEESMATELRGYLRQSLPEYMVPSAIVVMEQLPINENGKVDRRALPIPEEIVLEREAEFVAARDEIETELVKIWEELLGRTPSVKDNFFSIGGHSLLAVQLMASIEQRLGLNMPLTVLFQDGTIEGLAMLLRQGAGTRTGSSLVPIQPHGSQKPVFFVHPVGGGVFSYFELARRLGTDQPFYGLQALGFEDDRLPLTSIEEMASWYLEEIRRVQAEGPYRLGGWSLGGTVAFEMARQLRERGEEVELLILLDTMAPVQENEQEKMDDVQLLMAFAGDFAGANGFDFSNMQMMMHQLGRLAIDDALSMLYQQAKAMGSLPDGLKFEQVRRLFKIFKANTNALEKYEPTPGLAADVPIAFFRASTAPAHEMYEKLRRDKFYRWGQLAQQIDAHEAQGDHFTILSGPHLQALTDRILKCLAQAKNVQG